MLIRIDESIVRYIKDNLESIDHGSSEIIALNNLANAARYGYHLVIASFEVLDFLRGLNLLDELPKRYYHNLFQKFTFLASCEDNITEYINVKTAEYGFNRYRIENRLVIDVPIEYFANLYSILPTILLSEDKNDCEFYRKLTKKYISSFERLNGIHINFEDGGGGGQNSYKEYETRLNTNRIVLSIADSDKSTPDDKIGRTLAELKTVFNDYHANHITDLYELGVREKENLIPPSLLMLCSNNSEKDILEKLYRVEQDEKLQEKLKYIDIKGGITVKGYRKIINNEELLEYYGELFRPELELVSCAIEDIDKLDDDHLVICGVGGKLREFEFDILENGLETKYQTRKDKLPTDAVSKWEDKLRKKRNLLNIVPDYIRPEWDLLCNKIISWTCSSDLVSV